MSSIQRALISVSDKTGIADFARSLQSLGVEIVSTGGTAALLTRHGVSVKEVSEYTGFPEIMQGRLKTLHPKIHGGLLGRRGIDDKAMEEHGIQPIDLVVVNLYPFQQTVSCADCTLPNAIENIDIGGPTMLRAAAKNYRDVTVVVNTSDYATILTEMGNNKGRVCEKSRFDLAVKAFEHTAEYDGYIATYLGACDTRGPNQAFPRTFNKQYHKKQDLRYGENPHQTGAFYVEQSATEPSVATAQQIQGKELSYNNIADTDAALECVKQYSEPCCVIVKHANPCGVATDTTIQQAYQSAYSTDPTSAFGGIIAFNRPLDFDTATSIIKQQFVEVIIAPSIEATAREVLTAKKNVRALICGQWQQNPARERDFKRVVGGLLVQDRDQAMVTQTDLRIVSKRQPTEKELLDLMFCWKVAKFVKSNAIVYAKDQMTIGVGAGQMSRIYSARIAAIKAHDVSRQVQGAVMASDAFFPFRDGLDHAAEVGITAVIQPGGSMRDQEVIEAANEHNIAMIFTGMRHFRH